MSAQSEIEEALGLALRWEEIEPDLFEAMPNHFRLRVRRIVGDSWAWSCEELKPYSIPKGMFGSGDAMSGLLRSKLACLESYERAKKERERNIALKKFSSRKKSDTRRKHDSRR